MYRFMIAAYALATTLAWTSVPQPPPTEVDVVIVAEAAGADAALEAAWDRADSELDRQCRDRGFRGADATGGTEQVAPLDGTFAAEVYVGAVCR